MRFTRYERHHPIDFTARRQLAFARKQARERQRYPLFSDHVAAEQRSADEEVTHRVRRADSFESTMRAFHAKTWRKSRALYFQQPDAIRAEILAKWQTWTGPTTSTYFAWLVDVQSGDQARRVAGISVARRAANEPFPVQAGLDLHAR